MPGLIHKADGQNESMDPLAQARHKWEASMARQLGSLKESLAPRDPESIAHDSGVCWAEGHFEFQYWGKVVRLYWPSLLAKYAHGEPCSTFDTAMLYYYLTTADGSPLVDRWISFRELPGGAFYNRAFQGYSGDRIAAAFGDSPQGLTEAARQLGGLRLPALSDNGFAFQPLPRVRLASVLWLGDEDLPTHASVLFDAASSHYMITDGLALLGSGLAGRLIRAFERAN